MELSDLQIYILDIVNKHNGITMQSLVGRLGKYVPTTIKALGSVYTLPRTVNEKSMVTEGELIYALRGLKVNHLIYDSHYSDDEMQTFGVLHINDPRDIVRKRLEEIH
jgi:hypothetical protein